MKKALQFKQSTSRNLIIGALVALACLLPCSLEASTLLVTSTADDYSTGTLRMSLAVAVDGDVIDATGISGSISLTNGQLPVMNSITILGPGSGTLALNGNGSNRVFYILAGRNVTIAGLTISNGYASSDDVGGGGIYNDHSALTLSNCVVSGNSAVMRGGGILNNGFGGSASLAVIASTISSNTCTSSFVGGGGIYNYGEGSGNVTLLVDGSTVSDNSSGWNGGGIYDDANSGTVTATVTNSIVCGNLAAGYGGGFFHSGVNGGSATLSVLGSTIRNNSCAASYGAGGGIYSESFGGKVTNVVIHSTITGNSSSANGGGIFSGGAYGSATTTIISSTISSNSSVWNGAGIFNDGNNGSAMLAASNCIVSGNSAGISGAGIFNNGENSSNAIVSMVFSTISSNSATSYGGGFFNNGENSGSPTLAMSNCVVTGNSAEAWGGGIYNDAGYGRATVFVDSTTISGNSSRTGGNAGGIYNYGFHGSGMVTVVSSTISSNMAGWGGGIYNDGAYGSATLSVRTSAINSNEAIYYGGGIYNDATGGSVSLSVDGSAITGNSADHSDGGGIYSDGDSGSVTGTVVSSTISSNSSGNGGGGIYNSGYNGTAVLTIANSTVSGNLARFGGGIYNDGNQGSGMLTMANCTISSNLATNEPYSSGAGIYNDGTHGGSATNTISACTFSGNFSYFGSSIFNDGYEGNATMEIGDTILNDATPGNNIWNGFGTVVSFGYNLANDCGVTNEVEQTCGLSGTGDIINTDPRLGPLQDNGGPTWTHALLPCSPAIDQGKTNAIPALALNVDQRGFTRPVDIGTIADAAGGDGSDIGAFELQTSEAGGCFIICPGDQAFRNDPGVCGASVHYVEPIACGSCGTVICSPTNGSFFSVGTHTVTCTTNGIEVCSFTVTVSDDEAPTITTCAPALTNSANASGQATVPDFTGSVVATDNCTAANSLVITQVPAAGATVGLGTTNVTIYVTDAATNYTSCSTHFTVIGADLRLGMTGVKSSAKGNTYVTYTLSVTNFGPSAATNVVVTNVVPSGTVFTSASTTNGTFTTPAVGSTGTVRWSVGNMLNGAKAPAQIQVTVTVKGNKDITNTATVRSDTADPNLTNNTATVVTPTKGK